MFASGPVTFNYTTWVARYPEFAGVTEPVAELYFAEAQLYLDNSPCSRIQDANARLLMLNMITAHIAWLGRIGPDGQPINPLVGRIADASEGSVSVSAELQDLGKSAAFWTQSQYGLAFWQASNRYRRGVYVAPPPYRFGPNYFPGTNF